MDEPVSLDEAFGRFEETWSPRIAATVNDDDVKIARGAGEFPEHEHDDTDEYFHVLAGRLHLDLDGRTVTLDAGDVYVVPRGVRHRPRAAEGTRLLMFEPRGTSNTGDGTGTVGRPLDA